MTVKQLLLFEQITFLAQGTIFFYYSRSFFKTRYNSVITIANILASYIVLYAFSYACGMVFGFILAIVVNTLLLLLLFKGSLKTLLFHSVSLIALLGISELLCFAGIPIIIGKNTLSSGIEGADDFYALILGRLIYFILVIVICHSFSKKGSRHNNDKGFWALLIMPFSSIAAVSVLIYAMMNFEFIRQMEIVCAIASILLLVANIAVFFIYERSLENAEKLSELMVVQQRNELDNKYFSIIEQSNEDMKMLAHDIKNHFISIRGMDSIEAIGAYIDKLYPQLEQFYSVGNSQNKMLDLIISKYQTLCESEKISFEFDVRTANLSYVDDVDLSAMLNNLLDNSVEAARQSEGKRIELEIFAKNDMCDAVVIKNSCDKAPITSSGKLLSTKKNKKLHGIGLKSVATAAEKYNAFYDWSYDENRKLFVTTIVFPKEV